MRFSGWEFGVFGVLLNVYVLEVTTLAWYFCEEKSVLRSLFLENKLTGIITVGALELWWFV